MRQIGFLVLFPHRTVLLLGHLLLTIWGHFAVSLLTPEPFPTLLRSEWAGPTLLSGVRGGVGWWVHHSSLRLALGPEVTSGPSLFRYGGEGTTTSNSPPDDFILDIYLGQNIELWILQVKVCLLVSSSLSFLVLNSFCSLFTTSFNGLFLKFHL